MNADETNPDVKPADEKHQAEGPSQEKLSDDKDSADKREFLRKEIDRTACIKIPILCKLRDVSRSGARLVVDNPEALPDEFMLDLSADLHRWCHVIWRDDHQVGITFQDAPAHYRAWLAAKPGATGGSTQNS